MASRRLREREECPHGMPRSFGCDDCTIARLRQTIASDKALIQMLRNALDQAETDVDLAIAAINAADARLGVQAP